jgi:hypothetical protein
MANTRTSGGASSSPPSITPTTSRPLFSPVRGFDPSPRPVLGEASLRRSLSGQAAQDGRKRGQWDGRGRSLARCLRVPASSPVRGCGAPSPPWARRSNPESMGEKGDRAGSVSLLRRCDALVGRQVAQAQPWDWRSGFPSPAARDPEVGDDIHDF